MKFKKGKSGFTNRRHSLETKEKIRKALTGKKASKEAREKMSKVRKGIPSWNKGRYGKLSHRWKGGNGNRIAHGYVYVFKPNHPFATKTGHILRSRLVMEKKIGRLLTRKEVVHHINSCLNDDRKNNLMLFESSSKHRRHHIKIRKGSDFFSGGKV